MHRSTASELTALPLAALVALCGATTWAAPPPEAVQVVARFLDAEPQDVRVAESAKWQAWSRTENRTAYEVTYPSASVSGGVTTMAVWVDTKLSVVTQAIWPPTAPVAQAPTTRLGDGDLQRLAEAFMHKHPPVADASLLPDLQTVFAGRSPAGDRPTGVYYFRFATTRKADGAPFARQSVALDATDGRAMQYRLTRVHVECFDRVAVTREAAIEKARAELAALAPAGTQWDCTGAVLADGWWPTIEAGEAPVWVVSFSERRPEAEAQDEDGSVVVGIHAVDGSLLGVDGLR